MNKKLSATILLLVATLAFAADKYISSSGNIVLKTAASKYVSLNDTLYTTQAGKVGIGTAIPATVLDAAFDVRVSSGNNMGLIRNSSDVNGPNIVFKMTRGTETTPAIVQTGDALGGMVFYGATGVGQNILPGASIVAYVDSTVTTNDMPGRLVFSTTLDGSSGTTERMTIKNNGYVGIGTDAPRGALHAIGKITASNSVDVSFSTPNYGGVYYVNNGSNTADTCEAICAAAAVSRGYGSGYGHCFAAQNNAGVVRICSDTTNELKHCYCFGLG